MTIEKSPTAANPHKAARVDSQGSKARSTETDSQSGGFMAILGAMDAPLAVASDAPFPDAATAQSAASDSVTSPNSALDAATLLQQNPQIAAAHTQLGAATLTPATTTAIAASIATASSVAPAISAGATGGITDTSTLVAKSDPGPLQPSLPTDGSQAANASAKRPAAVTDLTSAGKSEPTNSVPVDSQTTGESATQGLQHSAGHAKSGKDFQTSEADVASTGSNAAAAPGEKVETMKWMAALEQAKAPLATKAMEPVFAPLLVKAERSTGERAASAFKTSEPGYSGTALGVSAPDYSQSGAAVATTAPEMQVAEQVTYWVSQNVQNAELKLDGLGQSPVEVSISVQGKEAQITFRTDEVSTRGVLEGASAHLKDMLQREGMVLTGVSVGTSGSGDSSGAERRARQAARQGVIAPLQVATVPTQDSGRRMGSVAGRSVDLFV
jgi:flagellar hook-length control protein FliK